ncbi:MAG TPA: hypothetical protein GX708_09830 [Gallicola sp.]|nr:hypothetical protein [Gallicola sp.]
MTIINCSSNCLYQIDGICHRDSLETDTLTSNGECVFFEDRSSSNAASLKYGEEPANN